MLGGLAWRSCRVEALRVEERGKREEEREWVGEREEQMAAERREPGTACDG